MLQMQILLVAAAFSIVLLPGFLFGRLYRASTQRTTLTRRFLFFTAVLCGVAAMGFWVLTQSDAGLSRDQGPVAIGIIGAGSGMLIVLMITSAYFGSRNGMGDFVRDCFFLIGVCAFLDVTFFVVVSRGMIFKFGLLPPTILILAGLATAFSWERKNRKPGRLS